MERSTIRQAISWATAHLEKHHPASPRLDAELLLMHTLGLTRVALFIHSERGLEQPELEQYANLIRRRSHGEPVAYLTGEKEFFGLVFMVTPHVLIPRPETEILVEQAINLAPRASEVLEIGVGSGAVLIALAIHRPDLTCFGVDISREAVKIAHANTRRHGVQARVHLLVGDVLQAVKTRFPLIVMNPPYIAQKDADQLSADVRDFEPAIALFGGNDGLDVIRKVQSSVRDNLKPRGTLIMEAGFDQRPAIEAMFAGTGGLKIQRWINDLAGHPRVVAVEREDG